MNAPGPLAVDSNGNVWVASYNGVASRFSPIGEPGFPSGITGLGLSQSYGLAIDLSDNVWITDENSPTSNGNLGAVTVLTSAGQPLSGPTGFSSGGLNYPVSHRHRSQRHRLDRRLRQLPPHPSLPDRRPPLRSLRILLHPLRLSRRHRPRCSTATPGSPTRAPTPRPHTTSPASPRTGRASFRSTAATPPPASPSTRPATSGSPTWAAAASARSPPPAPCISTGYTGGGLLHPQGIAIDGAGNVWVANFYGNSISELAGSATPHPGQPLSPAIGWAPTPASLHSFAIAVDSSGNLWISNFAANSITRITGLATPVKTPLSALPQLP